MTAMPPERPPTLPDPRPCERLALAFSEAGVTLLAPMEGGGWYRLGAARTADPDFEVDAAKLAGRAARHPLGTLAPLLILPPEQVLLREAEAGGKADAGAAAARMAEATGEPASALAVARARGQGGAPLWLAAYRQSCAEARAHARRWGFGAGPVCAAHPGIAGDAAPPVLEPAPEAPPDVLASRPARARSMGAPAVLGAAIVLALGVSGVLSPAPVPPGPEPVASGKVALNQPPATGILPPAAGTRPALPPDAAPRAENPDPGPVPRVPAAAEGQGGPPPARPSDSTRRPPPPAAARLPAELAVARPDAGALPALRTAALHTGPIAGRRPSPLGAAAGPGPLPGLDALRRDAGLRPPSVPAPPAMPGLELRPGGPLSPGPERSRPPAPLHPPALAPDGRDLRRALSDEPAARPGPASLGRTAAVGTGAGTGTVTGGTDIAALLTAPDDPEAGHLRFAVLRVPVTGAAAGPSFIPAPGSGGRATALPAARLAAAGVAPLPVPRPVGLSPGTAAGPRPLPATGSILPRPRPADVPPPGIRDDRIALIGVIDVEDGRRALLRMADGSVTAVRRGSRIGGWSVALIGADALRLVRGGEARTLLLVGR